MNDETNVTRTGARVGTIWGVIVMILGVMAMCMPFITGIALTAMIGIILIANGFAQFMYAFKSNSFGEGTFRFLFGLLAILAGISLVVQPGAGLATITLFLAIWFFADGIITLYQGFRWRPFEGWGWMVFSGIVSLILGLMIWRQFPVSAVWLVGVLVGIRLFFAGWTMIILGSVAKAIVNKVEETDSAS